VFHRSELRRGKPRLYIYFSGIYLNADTYFDAGRAFSNAILGSKTIRKRRSYPLSGLIDDIVYDSIFLSLLRIHDEVALDVLLHFIQLLAGVLCQ
jgi:hypothetical protein